MLNTEQPGCLAPEHGRIIALQACVRHDIPYSCCAQEYDKRGAVLYTYLFEGVIVKGILRVQNAKFSS